MVTPLLPNGDLDVWSLDSLIEHLVGAGVVGVLVMGSSGEAGMLDDEVRVAAVARTVERAGQRVHVMAGVPALGTNDAVRYGRMWTKLGVHSLLVTAPYGFRLLPSELKAHFRIVREAVGLPVMAYNVPQRVQTYLDPETLISLAADDVIQGLKDSSGDIERARLVSDSTAANPNFALYTGSENCMDSWLLGGFTGVLPGLANPFPSFHVALLKYVHDGDWLHATEIQHSILTLLELYQHKPSNARSTAAPVAGMKEALVQLGIIRHSTLARPFGQVDPTFAHHVAGVVERAKGLGASLGVPIAVRKLKD